MIVRLYRKRRAQPGPPLRRLLVGVPVGDGAELAFVLRLCVAILWCDDEAVSVKK